MAKSGHFLLAIIFVGVIGYFYLKSKNMLPSFLSRFMSGSGTIDASMVNTSGEGTGVCYE
jgi:uncharacterized membrane protein (UPF0136 family)